MIQVRYVNRIYTFRSTSEDSDSGDAEKETVGSLSGEILYKLT